MSVIDHRYHQWRWMSLVLITIVAVALPLPATGLSISYGNEDCENNSTDARSSIRLDAFNPELCGYGYHDPGNSVPAYCTSRTTKNRGASSSTSNKIGAGHYAVRGQFPSYAKVNIQTKNDGGQDIGIDCGGTIIHKNIVLTAAHCWDQRKLNAGLVKADVMVGDVDLYGSGQRILIDKICVHNRYVDVVNGVYNFAYDIAMVRLVSDIEYNDYVRPACLDTTNPHREDAACYAIGMGHINEAGYKDYRLKYVEMKRNCRLGPDGYIYDEAERKFFGSTCYKATSAGGGCAGDSGGPLMCFDICRGRYFQFVIGAISFGNRYENGQQMLPVCSEWNNLTTTYIADIHKITANREDWQVLFDCATIR